MMRYLYTIAGIEMLLDIPFSVEIKEDSVEFLELMEMREEQIESSDLIVVRFSPMDSITMNEDEGIRVDSRREVQEEQDKKIYIYNYSDIPYACLEMQTDRIVCRYLEKYSSLLNDSQKLFNLLGMEAVFLKKKTFILHSSFIRWKGDGILFTAPSGYGKSTQAALWEKYEHAEILNGDRAAINRKGEEWYAHGMPYAGTSGIYRNECAPVRVAFVIRKATQNRVRRLTLPEAVRYLYSEVTVHQWDEEFVNEIMNLLMEFAAQVPVYYLECLPDESAVELAKRVLEAEKEKEKNGWKQIQDQHLSRNI